ncbi:MAG: GAF domain-containing SpoIIE family protein phosphatase [Jatrophihabitans sp.]|uniref:GAF domain-containing SpoIIE family protein phosphatase n=1 Tax=Jatrophihabitans sp. TaxID=1932789 RepID=UPI003F7F7FC8
MATPESSARTPADVGPHRERFQELASVATELAAAETIVEVVDLITRRVSDVVDASVATVLLRQDDHLLVVGDTGLANPAKWSRFPLAYRTPVNEAVLENRPVVARWSPEAERRWPDLRGDVAPGRIVVCLPMTVQRSSIGALTLSFTTDTEPEPDELEFLVTYADTSGQAIRRIQATEAAARRARRLDFLAGASEQLSSDLDYRTTLQRVAELAVPDLADWCSVTLLEDGRLHTVAMAHVDPDKVAYGWRLQEIYPPDLDAPTGIGPVVRTGVSDLVTEVTDEMLVAVARDEEHLRVARELALHSAITVPLAARGHVFGAITLVRSETPAPYDAEDLAVAEDLARRAGLAIDNASLYTQTRDVALQLQRAVLPEALDDLPGWRVATLYRPGHHAEVGGDFYDAAALDDGRLAVFIGDVMGHGVAAAAAMAAMRSAVRAYLSIDPTPSAVVSKLDQMFAQLRIRQLVTLVYGVLDGERFIFVNAGHHAPVVVGADGSSRVLSTPPARPLGAGGDVRVDHAGDVGDAETVLLFTDGLVERRGEIIDEGIERLMTRTGTLAGADLPTALHDLVEVLADNPDDDVTALAVRRSKEHSHG